MKISRNSLRHWAVVAALVSIACNSFYDPRVVSIFDNQLAQTPEFLHKSPGRVQRYRYEKEMLGVNATQNDHERNVESWYNYFKGEIGRGYISMYLYPDEESIVNLRDMSKDRNDKDLTNYVDFVMTIDSLMQYNKNNMWDAILLDSTRIKATVHKMENSFIRCKMPFLKERYFYKIIQSYFGINQFKKVVSFYEQYNKKIKLKSFVFEKATCDYAGALFRAGRPSESYYIYAKVFQNNPFLRETVVNGFKVYNIPYSSKALDFCTTKSEKCTVIFLSAINKSANLAQKITDLYDIDPNYPFIEYLVMKEIKKQEYYYYDFACSYRNNPEPSKARPSSRENDFIKAQTYFTDIDQVLQRITHEKKVQNLDFYNLAFAYTSLLMQRDDQVLALLNEVKNAKNDALIDKQKKILFVEHQLLTDVPYDPKHLDSVFQYMQDFRYFSARTDEDIRFNFSEHLSRYFLIKKSQAKSSKEKFKWDARIFFAQMYCYSQKNNIYSDVYEKWFIGTKTTAELKQYLQFCQMANSSLDRKLIDSLYFTKNDLKLAYTRRLVLEGNFQEAQKYTDQLPDSLWGFDSSSFCTPQLYLKKEKLQPFNDAHEYISRMAYLQNYLSTHPQDGNGWLELGEAWLNITYFGTAHNLARRYWSTGNLNPSLIAPKSEELNKLNRDNYFHLKGPKMCLEKAIQYCRDPELQTKAYYLQLFCKKYNHYAQYFINEPRNGYLPTDKSSPYLPINKYGNFDKISSFVGQSELAKKIIEECDTYLRYSDWKH